MHEFSLWFFCTKKKVLKKVHTKYCENRQGMV
jgi:hypothetical protein